jgi:hypothetical protein
MCVAAWCQGCGRAYVWSRVTTFGDEYTWTPPCTWWHAVTQQQHAWQGTKVGVWNIIVGAGAADLQCSCGNLRWCVHRLRQGGCLLLCVWLHVIKGVAVLVCTCFRKGPFYDK